MRQRLVPVGAWTLVTGAAVALSWYGVHTVVSGTAYDPPRAVPISDDWRSRTAAGATEPEPPSSSSGRPGSPSPSATPSRSAAPAPPATTSPPPAPPAPPVKPSSTPTATSSPSGGVRSYTVKGGRVVLELRPDHCTLVSATPNSGWDMQVWKQNKWIRVTFSEGSRASSVFCVWNGTPPQVRIDEHG